MHDTRSVCCAAAMAIAALFTVSACESTHMNADEQERTMQPPAYSLPDDVASIPNLIEREGEWSVDLIEVNPWYNRMPPVGEENPAGRRHLVSRAVINNQTETAMIARLVEAYIAFDPDALGERVPEGEFTLIDERGMPSGNLRQRIEPESFKNQLRFRGEDLFGPGHDDDTLYLTLVLELRPEAAESGEYLILRRGGDVVVAM